LRQLRSTMVKKPTMTIATTAVAASMAMAAVVRLELELELWAEGVFGGAGGETAANASVEEDDCTVRPSADERVFTSALSDACTACAAVALATVTRVRTNTEAGDSSMISTDVCGTPAYAATLARKADESKVEI
jgi:hypothetical protein